MRGEYLSQGNNQYKLDGINKISTINWNPKTDEVSILLKNLNKDEIILENATKLPRYTINDNYDINIINDYIMLIK